MTVLFDFAEPDKPRHPAPYTQVPCPGMRWGQNGNERIQFESVVLLVLP